MLKTSETLQKLVAGRQLLVEKGLCKHQFYRGDGSHCAIGAAFNLDGNNKPVGVFISNDLARLVSPSINLGILPFGDKRILPLAMACFTLFPERCAHDKISKDFYGQARLIARTNDHPDTTLDDMVRVFDHAIAICD